MIRTSLPTPRKAVGVSPNIARNTSLKCEGEAKPASTAALVRSW